MSERIEDFPDVEWQQPDLFNVRRARNESIEILSGNINSREGGRKKNSICINSFSVSFQTKNFHVSQGQKSFWCIIEVLFLYTISRHFRRLHSPTREQGEDFMQRELAPLDGGQSVAILRMFSNKQIAVTGRLGLSCFESTKEK